MVSCKFGATIVTIGQELSIIALNLAFGYHFLWGSMPRGGSLDSPN